MSPAPVPAATVYSDARARILAAAQRLFAESGYDSTSISRVAQSAGVSKANIFHHFSSKQDLYLEVLHESRSHLENLFDDLKLSGDLTQRLARFLDRHLTSIYEREAGFRLLLHEMLTGEQHEAIAKRVGGDNFRRLVANLRAAQQQGDVRTGVDPAVVAFVLVAASAFFYLSRPVLRHTPEAEFADRPDHYVQQVADLITFGLRSVEERS
ncbi:MAG: TetR/AcrR family transcriptional regulator [Gammaproteobacteria bacterium]|nr:TetR/AcrR family transcriptional regulator [Gammaproteobacteria bacterium]